MTATPTGRVRTRTVKGKEYHQVYATDPTIGVEKSYGSHPTRAAADAALARLLVEIELGAVGNPDSRRNFGDWALHLLATEPMSENTRREWGYLYANYIGPAFSHLTVAQVTPPRVRDWRNRMTAEKPPDARGGKQPPKAYKLLHWICQHGVVDGYYPKGNPVNIPKGGVDVAPERDITVATWGAVYAIADTMPARYRALVLLMAYIPGRIQEWAAVTRADVDLAHRTIRLGKQLSKDGRRVLMPKNKSKGKPRPFGANAADILAAHLDAFVGPEPTARLFDGPKGAPLRAGNFREDFWNPACRAVGITPGVNGLRIHDMRHVSASNVAAATHGNAYIVQSFLNDRSRRAADGYVHTAEEMMRDAADAVDAAATAALAERANVVSIHR